jgi:membrane protein YqaA with SNARE-associated domain
VDDFLTGLFAFLGSGGALAALFLIFVVDAALFPALPEVAIVLAYSFVPMGLDPIAWAALLLAMAVGGEIVGNSTLYLVVKRAVVQKGRMPRWIERLMTGWVNFLLVRDERLILLNRIAPVLPMVGAFIATLRWDVRRSLAYIAVGATAKYTALLVLTGLVGVAYDPATARWLAIGFVLGIVAISGVAALVMRRRARRAAGEP